MRKITLILVLVFSQFIFANEDRNNLLNEARKYSSDKLYSKAIKHYIKYIKAFRNESVDLRNVYFEVANCYYLSGNKKMATLVVSESIEKFGVIKMDLELSKILNRDTFEFVWADIYNNYDQLRKNYVNRVSNVDQYMSNNKGLVLD